jgi:hypothetical protein
MAGSVIDSLVITLGLDSKEFARGVKGSTEELATFTKRLAGMFLAVRGLEDVVGYFKDLHAQLAEIGFTSRNLGVAGTEIKKLGEVSELFGGQVNDAADSIQNLQNSVFNLRYKGQLSENLLMLQRFGVAYLTASGHARSFKDVALDAARAIERQAKAAGMDKGERYQMALSFGFTGGVASAVAQGGKGLEAALGKAQIDQRALSEKTIQGQVKLDQDITRLQEATAAQSSAILSKLTPVAEDVVKGLRHLADEVLPKLVDALNALINFFKNPPPWAAGIIDGIKTLSNALGPGGTLIAAIGALTLAIGAGGALIGVMGTLVSAIGGLGLVLAGGVGLGAAIAKVPSGGLLDKLNEKFLDWFGPGSSAAEKAAIGSTGPPRLLARPPATPGAARPLSPTGAGGSTSTSSNATAVHIDEVNINTTSSTMSGTGADLGNALGRKLLVANADQGQG